MNAMQFWTIVSNKKKKKIEQSKGVIQVCEPVTAWSKYDGSLFESYRRFTDRTPFCITTANISPLVICMHQHCFIFKEGTQPYRVQCKTV